MSAELPSVAERSMARRYRLTTRQWNALMPQIGLKSFLLMTHEERLVVIGRFEGNPVRAREDAEAWWDSLAPKDRMRIRKRTRDKLFANLKPDWQVRVERIFQSRGCPPAGSVRQPKKIFTPSVPMARRREDALAEQMVRLAFMRVGANGAGARRSA